MSQFLNWSNASGTLAAVMKKFTLVFSCSTRAEKVMETFLLRQLKGENFGRIVYDEQFGEYSEKLPLTPIGQLLTDTQYGLSEPAVNGGQFRMLRMMDLADGVAVDSDSAKANRS